MLNWLIAYLATGLIFGLCDAVWLRFAGPGLYRPMLGDLLAPSFRLIPAVIFYLIYVAGMVWFAVRPGVVVGVPFGVLNGAILGLLCYVTYDLTNQATMKIWPWQVTLIDIAWGMAATAFACGGGAFAVRKFIELYPQTAG
jgi:uncharacterized membrane protein